MMASATLQAVILICACCSGVPPRTVSVCSGA
jgi:hypothetical protein